MFQFNLFLIVCVPLQLSCIHLTLASSLINNKAADFWTTLGVVPVVIDAAPPETLAVMYVD